MKGIAALLDARPALISTLTSAVVGVALAVGVDPKLGSAVGALLAVLAGLWTQSRVFAPASVARVATNAATAAVAAVSAGAAGKVGELTEAGESTAVEAAHTVLATVGVTPSDQAKA